MLRINEIRGCLFVHFRGLSNYYFFNTSFVLPSLSFAAFISLRADTGGWRFN